MKEERSRRSIRWVSGTLLAVVMVVLCILSRGLSVEDILRYTPANPLIAVIVITLMTAAASMIPVFPMMIFYFACGMLFPFFGALAAGAIGIFVEAMLQYLIGRRMGASYVDKWLAKYPKLAVIRTWKVNNDVMLTYILRISGLPVNMVSLFIGAAGVEKAAYLLGTYIGMIPGLISCVLISMQVKQEFTWGLVLLIVLINAGSFGVAFAVNRFARAK